MRKQEIVMVADGENQGTYGFMCFSDNFTGDINETCERFVSWDCDILVTVPKYKLVTATMPEWMDEQSYRYHHISLKYAVGLCGECVYSMTERAFFRLTSLTEKERFFYGWMRSKKKLSEFHQSILSQFDAWLEADEQKHRRPLSERQWEAATRYVPLYEAKQISNRLYYSR